MKLNNVGRAFLASIVLPTLAFTVFLPTAITETAEQKPIEYIKEATSTPKNVLTDADLPKALLDISYCESHDKQFNADGSVRRGILNHKDIGKWQINEKYWLAKSKELGFDIYTLDGNRQMALWIYNRYGATPWHWSATCHHHY